MASLFLMATAESSGMLVLSIGFLVGISTGAASFAVVLAAVGRLVPPARRSMALGVVTAMGSVGQFVLIPTAQQLLAVGTWQRAIVILGLVVLGATLVTPPFRGRAVDQLARAGLPRPKPAPRQRAGLSSTTAKGIPIGPSAPSSDGPPTTDRTCC